jgi:hypothetical protein
MAKLAEQTIAVTLRREGLTYSEIRKKVNVAKATLSLWFKEVGLSKAQKQRITQKRLDAALRGALKRKTERIKLCQKIKEESSREVCGLNRNVYLLAGAALYWAEGNKQKEHSVSSPVIFSNSDGEMIKFFYKWLTDICKIQPCDIYFEIYIHENCDPKAAKIFWSKTLNLDLKNFEKIRFKKDKGNSYRKNKGSSYNGLLRVRVRKSTNLNRQIMGWVSGMSKQFTNYSEVV